VVPAALGRVPDVVATRLFVPCELHELAGKITVIRVGAFAVNLAILF
jgi:uncharacterized membrane protein (DUF2068 family)